MKNPQQAASQHRHVANTTQLQRILRTRSSGTAYQHHRRQRQQPQRRATSPPLQRSINRRHPQGGSLGQAALQHVVCSIAPKLCKPAGKWSVGAAAHGDRHGQTQLQHPKQQSSIMSASTFKSPPTSSSTDVAHSPVGCTPARYSTSQTTHPHVQSRYRLALPSACITIGASAPVAATQFEHAQRIIDAVQLQRSSSACSSVVNSSFHIRASSRHHAAATAQQQQHHFSSGVRRRQFLRFSAQL